MKQAVGQGKISNILIYEKKGAAPVFRGSCEVTVEQGMDGDWHGSDSKRQISILPAEVRNSQKDGFCLKKFKENIQTEGMDFSEISSGAYLKMSGTVLQITGAFKKCYPELCDLAKSGQECPLRNQAVFAKVVKGGRLQVGESVELVLEEQ